MSETMTTPKEKSAPRSQKRVAVFGTFVLIFAIIGVIATVIGAVRLTANLVDNTAQKNRFKQATFPLVLLDPPAFDSIDKLDSRTVLTAGIWDFIIFAEKDKYAEDDLRHLTVPAVDIEAHIVKLFGKDAVIEHQEIADSDLQILYDAESKTYSIPSSATPASYIPDIEQISREGDVYTLKVGYVPIGTVWGSDITGEEYEEEPDKYLTYVLKKTGSDSYIITAVQEYREDAASSAANTSSKASTSSEETVSGETASGEVTSGETVSGETVSGETASGEAESGSETGSESTSDNSDSSEAAQE